MAERTLTEPARFAPQAIGYRRVMNQLMKKDPAQVQQESVQKLGRRGQKVQSAEMTMAVLRHAHALVSHGTGVCSV